MDSLSPALVSIVMPSYNHGHLISRAIDSVLMQSYPHWELIIIDNHSTDTTKQLIRAYKDSRIKIFEIHNDGIIAASRNEGVRHAVGDWVAFLDSDDWWTTDKLAVCVRHLHRAVDVLYHDLALTGVGSSVFRRRKIKCWQTKSPVLLDLLVRGNALATSAVIARRTLLLQVAGHIEGRDFSAASDYACWLNLARLSEDFYYLPKILGFYLVHSQGTSRRDMSDQTAKACAPFVHLLNSPQLRVHQSWLRYARGRHLFTNGKPAEAVMDLKFALASSKSLEIRFKSLVMLCLFFFGIKG